MNLRFWNWKKTKVLEVWPEDRKETMRCSCGSFTISSTAWNTCPSCGDKICCLPPYLVPYECWSSGCLMVDEGEEV